MRVGGGALGAVGAAGVTAVGCSTALSGAFSGRIAELVLVVLEEAAQTMHETQPTTGTKTIRPTIPATQSSGLAPVRGGARYWPP
jgi:hypothetical protein